MGRSPRSRGRIYVIDRSRLLALEGKDDQRKTAEPVVLPETIGLG